MENRKTLFLFICAFLLIGVILIGEINFQSLATDSGFDTSYDSGGSSWDSGGSSWDYDSSYDYHTSSSGTSGGFDFYSFLVFLGMVVIIIVIVKIIMIIQSYLQKNHFYNQAKFAGSIFLLTIVMFFSLLGILCLATLIENTIIEIIIMLAITILLLIIYISKIKLMRKEMHGDIIIDKIIRSSKKSSLTEEYPEILTNGYKIYREVQDAWMNFDYDALRKLVTDDLFNSYQNQLKTLELKEQQNIMETFRKRESYLKTLKEENGVTTTEMVLKVSFYDYIIDKDKNVVRGTKSRRVIMTYLLTFVSSSELVDTCPHCGAKLEDGETICNYCKSNIQISHQMKLAKKEVLKQEISHR